jgi:hypothetical protein
MNPPIDPAEAERQFASLLERGGLPPYTSCRHDPDANELEFVWEEQKLIVFVGHEFTDGELDPIDDEVRAAILGEPEPIHVSVPGSADDPRIDRSIPGVVIHHTPPMHPDDLTTVDRIPVTSVSRTLIDLAEVLTVDELRDAFARASAVGLLDPEALRASRARVEWRPSLEVLDEVIAEFCG